MKMVPSRNFFGHEIVIAISDHFTFPSSNVVLIILTFTFHFNSKAHFFIIWVKGLFGIALTVHGSLTFFLYGPGANQKSQYTNIRRNSSLSFCT
jgi:hypothetical protein